MKILRDTGAAQSLILRRSVPNNFVFSNNDFVVLGGFPNTVVSCPLEKFYLETDYFKGTVKLAVVDCLPVPGIDLVFANDLVVKDELNYFPILSLVEVKCDDDCDPISIVTRSRAREVNLEEVNLNLDEVSRQETDIVTSSINRNIIFDDVNWDVEAFKEAQMKEFCNFDVDDPDNDISKPFFIKQDGLLYRVSRAGNAPADQVEVVKQLVVPEKYRNKLL